MFSQFQDQHNVSFVLVDIMQCDDVGVTNLLENPDFPLNLLSQDSAPAGIALSLFYELGSKLQARALLPTLLYNGELSTETAETEGAAHLLLSVSNE